MTENTEQRPESGATNDIIFLKVHDCQLNLSKDQNLVIYT